MLGEAAINMPNNGTVVLRLAEAVQLGLANNSEIRTAYLDRIARKSALRAMEERFSPKLPPNGSYVVSQNLPDQGSQTEFSPTGTMQGETDSHFSQSWTNRISHGEYGVNSQDDGVSFTVVQPLMWGAGLDIVAAPLQQARLNEQISHLNLKATISDVVTQIIFTYHEVLRAQEQSRLVREALARAHRSLSTNTYKAAAGYWFESDFTGLVYAEADIASRELTLKEIENRLDANRQQLLRLLGLQADIKIHAADALEVPPVKAEVAGTVAAALKRQPAYLIQYLLAERATIELSGERTHVDARNQDARLIEARKALEYGIDESVRDLKARWRQCEAARHSLKLARMKMEAERKRAKKIPGDGFRLHVVESNLYNAEFTRIDTLVAYRNALAALDKLSGATLDNWKIELND
jgi:outer membrane protein TolC